jgi:predicted transposase/invertase (TIGR01784 family)
LSLEIKTNKFEKLRTLKMNNIYNENERFIPIISDYGFKVTFGNESDTRFLKKALQALVSSPIPIREITFVTNEVKGITIDSRGSIYDLSCVDEENNHFIVEMQLSEYPEFIQRMKFYSLHRFNTLVKKGKYTFDNLPKIYCIGILATNIFPQIADYHNIAVLRNVKGELIDDQMTFITVELAKFKKKLKDVHSDLDKLIYTMKNLHKIKKPIQYPQFWDEEWLNIAIQELDKKAMTPEQRLGYEMAISANALVVKNENKKIQKVEERVKSDSVKIALQKGKLTIEEIAEYNQVTVDFVLDIQNQISRGNS